MEKEQWLYSMYGCVKNDKTGMQWNVKDENRKTLLSDAISKGTWMALELNRQLQKCM